MTHENHPDVLIVGAGPVGLFAALSLARQGVLLRVVDTGVWACKHSYALALHSDSLALFQELGLLKSVWDNSYPVRALGFYSSTGRHAQVQIPDLAVVRQDSLESILEEALRGYGVRVEWRHEVSALSAGDGWVTANLDRFEKDSRGYAVAHTEWAVAGTESLSVPFVLGADGYNSRVRRSLNIEFEQAAPAQYCAVFEFDTDADLQNEVRIVLGERTTDVLWPLPGNKCRWSFHLPDYSDPEAEQLQDRLRSAGFGYFPMDRPKDRAAGSAFPTVPVLEESSLRQLLAERAPWFSASISAIHWRTMVRFERRLARAFGQRRQWLAGDAAHLTGPIGMQSMNLGLFEAYDYASTVKRVLSGASLNEFEAYGERWRDEWKRLQGMTGGLQPTADADPWLASHAGKLLPCLPSHGAGLTALAATLGMKV